MNCPTCEKPMVEVTRMSQPTKSRVLEDVMDEAKWHHRRVQTIRRTDIVRYACKRCNWKWQGQRTYDVDEAPYWNCITGICTVPEHQRDRQTDW